MMRNSGLRSRLPFDGRTTHSCERQVRVLGPRGAAQGSDHGSRPRLSPSKQDFEALTPNLLARTVETVEGGGVVVMLLSTLDSLSQLYSLTMDVHSRLRTESHQQVTGEHSTAES